MSAIPTPILIDCDPGHDDAIALLLALASPEVQLLAVTSVAGNQTLDKTTANAIRVLEFAGHPDIEVAAAPTVRSSARSTPPPTRHTGRPSHGPYLPPPGKAPVPQHAADFLAEKIRSSEQPVTLVAVGPLTNVALLLALHPDARPERIVLMGGAIAKVNVTPAAEFNIWCDPGGGRARVASASTSPWKSRPRRHAQSVVHTQAHIGRLAGRVGGMVTLSCCVSTTAFIGTCTGFDGSPIHDALAVAHVLGHDLVETAERNVEIETESELCRGRTVVDSATDWTARRTRTLVWRSTRKVFSSCWSSASIRRTSLVFAAIAPHGTLPEAPVPGAETTDDALAELGRRFDAAAPDATIVLTPHNVHVEGHFAVTVAGTVAGSLAEFDAPDVKLACPVDVELAAQSIAALRDEGLPAVGVSFGGNDPATASAPLDWGALIPLWCMGGRSDPPVPAVVVSPARRPPARRARPRRPRHRRRCRAVGQTGRADRERRPRPRP